jgi:hypothetical protein
MQRFTCDCGQPVFFENAQCTRCGARLGFAPERMTMLSLVPQDGAWAAADGSTWLLCSNAVDFGVCNWIHPAAASHPLCRACQFNRTVPNQALSGNPQRWLRLEQAKKRLLYTLMQLQLPLENGWDAPGRGLLFDFVENTPHTGGTTGHLGGVITINVLEADDVAREAQRQQLNERYRTVLGHLRHESGHYYWQRLNPNDEVRGAFSALFGDEQADYAGALRAHYRDGPPADWRSRFISAYASAHPAEDWAESWGHYLHIYDALETAAAHGLSDCWPGQITIDERIEHWRELSVTLNELNRSIGLADAYPFVLNLAVEMKLGFVDRVIGMLQEAPAH